MSYWVDGILIYLLGKVYIYKTICLEMACLCYWVGLLIIIYLTLVKVYKYILVPARLFLKYYFWQNLGNKLSLGLLLVQVIKQSYCYALIFIWNDKWALPIHLVTIQNFRSFGNRIWEHSYPGMSQTLCILEIISKAWYWVRSLTHISLIWQILCVSSAAITGKNSHRIAIFLI